METINSYLNNMFAILPQTEQIKKVKAELLDSMTDKYNELKKEGKSENEAVGIVISEFGNIDDLLKEMNISPISGIDADKPTLWITQQEAEDYLKAKKRTMLQVAVGVVMILWGVIAMVMLAVLSEETDLGDRLSRIGLNDAFPVVLLLLVIAIAVSIFIVSGVKADKYKYIEEGVGITPEMCKDFTARMEAYVPTYTIALTSGVFMCILGIIIFLLVGNMSGNEEINGAVGMSIMLFFISIATFMFIYIVGQKENYEAILGVGEFTKSKRESNSIVGIVGSVVWPIAVAVFLIWGLVYDGFGISWIVFPVVGILFGAFSALCNAVIEQKNKA